MKNDEFVSNAADCIHEFNWKDPQAGLGVAEHFLILCSSNKSDPQETAKLINDLTDLCAEAGITLPQALETLKAENWETGSEDIVSCAGLKVLLDADEVCSPA